jgi:AraC family transcriptional regulator, regulatory protein of adaptative response / methylated-DNA-[protein]-cysteine methyltransferase
MTRTTTTLFVTADQRWRALEQRDDRADGAFVYGVRTTGVFCRPGCRSRRPKRANVLFFDDLEAAERAGFRSCKRCVPGASRSELGPSRAIARACSLIETAQVMPGLHELASEVGLSPGYLHRLFKRKLGVTPKEFAMSLRADRLRDGLVAGKPVTRAILDAGFGSVGRAYGEASEELGMTPGEYRQRAAGHSIRFATAPTTLGWLLIAATDRGLCAIELGDSAEELIQRLYARFPNAKQSPDVDMNEQLGRVVALVEEPGVGLDLPLDIRGTAFQRQVWEALRALPVGSTVTYAEVARSIGRPSAVRAVASACASNELAVVIPCHRVIRGDGGLGGYRWGIERKQALIDAEKGK